MNTPTTTFLNAFKKISVYAFCLTLASNSGCQKEEVSTPESQIEDLEQQEDARALSSSSSACQSTFSLNDFKTSNTFLAAYDVNTTESIWKLKYNNNSAPRYVIVTKQPNLTIKIEIRSCAGTYLYNSNTAYNISAMPAYIKNFVQKLATNYSDAKLSNQEYTQLKALSQDQYAKYYDTKSYNYIYNLKNDWVKTKINKYWIENGIAITSIKMLEYPNTNFPRYSFYSANGFVQLFDAFGAEMYIYGNPGTVYTRQTIAIN